jgi:hypothetical protein
MENPLKMCPAGSRQGLLRPVGSRDNSLWEKFTAVLPSPPFAALYS